MNIRQQSEAYLESLQSRRRDPITSSTLSAYQSYLRIWIVPLVGGEDLETFKNGGMKKFVAHLSGAESRFKRPLAASTITGIVNCLKDVIGSAKDDDGEEVYPRKWSNDFTDLPKIVREEQKAPTIGRSALETAISGAEGILKPLYATLAGTGLRIAECRALAAAKDGKSNLWDRDRRIIVVKGQLSRLTGQFVPPKTRAGYRTIELCEAANDILCQVDSPPGYLFNIPLSTAYEATAEDGVPAFHSLRRFRITRLRETGVPEDIVKFWVGHGSKDITDRYSKLAQNEALRKEWAEKAGLGFSIGD
jgi:hypothetical protein